VSIEQPAKYSETYREDYEKSAYNGEVRELGTEFLASHEIPGQRFSCHTIDSVDRYSRLGRAVEGTVFFQEFKDTPQKMAKHYDRYEPASTFFVVMDQQNAMPVGAMRIIGNSEAGLKCFVDLPKTPLASVTSQEEICDAYGIVPDRCVDLATLAVLAEYRGADDKARQLLFRSLYLNVITNPDIDHMITIIDAKAQRGLWALRFPFHRVLDTEGFKFSGSKESFFMYAKNSEFDPQITFWVNKFRQDAAEGSGLAGMRAALMDELIHENSPLDDMLGTNKPAYPRIK